MDGSTQMMMLLLGLNMSGQKFRQFIQKENVGLEKRKR
jgi:hypothetical protein